MASWLEISIFVTELNVVQERGIGTNEAGWKIVLFVLWQTTVSHPGTVLRIMTGD